MSVLVTGARGFIGLPLLDELVRNKIRVRALTSSRAWLGEAHGDPQVVEWAYMAGIAQDCWQDVLSGISTVIHLAARVHVMRDTAPDPLAEFRRVNTRATEELARAAASGGVKRLVYVSSIKVNGEETQRGQKFSESLAAKPEDAYAVSKWEAEQALHKVSRETGLEVVIVRPPLVYGPRVKGNFAQMLSVVARGIPLPLASIDNRRSLVYVGNLVNALVACAVQPAAAGQTYLVSDGDDVSTPELLRQLAAALNVPSRLFHCPSSWLRLAGKLTGKSRQAERLLGSLEVDSAKIRRDLNWVPPYTLQQGLQATAEWYRNQHK
ncbi:MAG: NAD-dependent epimerase/dehydratase family protein [Sideroxydans sp.]|nr:NAD-dependent epimerase/dehydratase family protein [Sideroxydans sp.]